MGTHLMSSESVKHTACIGQKKNKNLTEERAKQNMTPH